MKDLPFNEMQSGWQLLKKWCDRIETDPETITDSDWDQVIKDTERIWLESGKDELVMDMVCAFLKEIERRYMKRVDIVER